MKDIVNITCYNKTEQMARTDAIAKYTEAMAWSDGSEMQRYATILNGLFSGLTNIRDEY